MCTINLYIERITYSSVSTGLARTKTYKFKKVIS